MSTWCSIPVLRKVSLNSVCTESKRWTYGRRKPVQRRLTYLRSREAKGGTSGISHLHTSKLTCASWDGRFLKQHDAWLFATEKARGVSFSDPAQEQDVLGKQSRSKHHPVPPGQESIKCKGFSKEGDARNALWLGSEAAPPAQRPPGTQNAQTPRGLPCYSCRRIDSSES